MQQILIDEPGFVRWEVPAGLSVVIGPNGCGKTRLCGVLWGVAGNHPDGPILTPDTARDVTGDVNGHGARRLIDLHPLAADPCVIDDVDLHLSPNAIRKLLMALAESHRRCVVTTHSPVAINAAARLAGRDCLWALDARAPGGIVNVETTDIALRHRLGWPHADYAAQFALGDLYAAEEIAAPPRLNPGGPPARLHESERGITRSRVMHYQQRLRDLGATDEPPDGILSERTRAGIRSFQGAWNRHNPTRHLPVDGLLGPETRAALDEARPPAAQPG